MSVSRLALLIATRNATPDALATMATDAFSADLLHLINANNEQPLSTAVAALPMGKAQVKGKQNQALGAAIAQAVKVTRAALPDNAGWIGAVHGQFSKASKDARTPYLIAHAEGVAAFALSLEQSGAFAPVVKKTEAEKAAAKSEREEAAAKVLSEQVKAAIDARIVAGELVKREDVRILADYTPIALIGQLHTLMHTLSADDVAELCQLAAQAADQAQKLAA